ncbi:phosphoenolpyruvate synthase [Actinophytocola xanthii]|uniref:Pyruvate, water dikinase n=1 Tax=Actinophytocola xanthii TaxID=1912961 RepID=A0A1Q8CNP7_9PSEU|nr:phosphoenolpyruvate synthase [Actinophytocola xanthii]OLF15946.1 pyruvate, water dikinase [Actinophytocola xanthii]
MSVITSETPSADAARLAGAKGHTLHRLTEHGADVPEWAVIGVDVFDRFLRANGLVEKVREHLVGVTADTADLVAVRIEELVLGTTPEPDLLATVRRAYEHVGAGRVAVRSSGAEEDGARYSFAGQFSTFLNIGGLDSVVAHVRRCWASAYSAQALRYRLAHGLPCETSGMAVVVQRMVPADKSGVLFTANPLGGDPDEYMISAVLGLGEGLVSGLVDADTVLVDRRSGAVREVVVGDKRERVDPDEHGDGSVTTVVGAEARAASALSGEEVARLVRVASDVVAAFSGPQDIEWAIADDSVWILQSRPVTGPVRGADPSPRGELRIWDNSNIIESFSDITSPMTFSFAAHVYHQVYRQYCQLLAVPRHGMRQMDEWLPTMLGYFHGRVYYNLLNWYRVIRLAPFYRVNRQVLEVSMGLAEPLPDELAMELRPFSSRFRWQERPHRAVIVTAYWRRFLAVDRTVRDFLRHFATTYREFDDVDFDALPADEVYQLFRKLERTLLDRWGAMIVLEAVIGLSFGLLQKLTERWLPPDVPRWLPWAVANPAGVLESAEPAYRFERLAATIRADEELSRLVRETAPEQLYATLADRGLRELVGEIDAYIADFGYRSVNELKLEEPDLRQDPSRLFVMLRGALAFARQNGNDSQAAERILDRHLHGLRRIVYQQVRRRVRRSLADRERVRFCRTRAFGMARRMIRAMGASLARLGALNDERDVFYLRLDELRGCFDGTIAHRELASLVDLRKRQHAQDRELVAPPRFTTYGPVYWGGNLERAGWDPSSAGGAVVSPRSEVLRGVPCGPGVVEGEAKVVTEPHDVEGAILVTYRTDPGWIAALPAAKALLIERGSPLTHVAIVARELGIPCVVQIRNVTREIATGMRLRVDGGEGTVHVLSDENTVS